jgi:hypothetical protein
MGRAFLFFQGAPAQSRSIDGAALFAVSLAAFRRENRRHSRHPGPHTQRLTPPFARKTTARVLPTMAISGKDLGTSFGINTAVCLAFLLVFSFLRTRKPFSLFYSPKR